MTDAATAAATADAVTRKLDKDMTRAEIKMSLEIRACKFRSQVQGWGGIILPRRKGTEEERAYQELRGGMLAPRPLSVDAESQEVVCW